MKSSKILQYLEELKKNQPKLALKYIRSKSLKDVLFRAECKHVKKPIIYDINNFDNYFENVKREDNNGIEDKEEENYYINCDQSKIIYRKPHHMYIYYSLVTK